MTATQPVVHGGRETDVGGREASRKAVHIAVSIAAAGIVWQLPLTSTRPLFIAAFVLALGVDLLRRRSTHLGRLFERAFGAMLRSRESRQLTGATTLAAGFALTVLLTPPQIAAVGILVAGLADAAAALVGRRYGRHRIRNGKSVEGGAASFVTSLLLLGLAPGTNLLGALIIAPVLTLLEIAPLPVDDNVVLPIAAALLYQLVSTPIV